MSQLTFDEAKQRLVQKVDVRFQTAHERRSLFLVAIIIMPMALGPAYFPRYSREAPMWPFIPLIILYLLWNLGIYLRYRPISFTEYKALSTEEKERRVLYDSMWMRLFQTGIGGFIVIGFLWGTIEASLYYEVIWLPTLLIILFLVFLICILYYRKRIAIVYAEGFHTHKRLNRVISIVVGIFATAPILIGISNMMRVQMGQENMVKVILPLWIFLMLAFVMTISIMTLLAVTMSYVQYDVWKNS
jgi:hypothetical protein